MNLGDKTIMVVDDSNLNLLLYEKIFQKLQLESLVCKDGEEALRLARTKRPNLIILDVEMPGLNGYDVCRQLKRDPLTRGIPVIFVTQAAEKHKKARGMSLGALDYLTKPVDMTNLMNKVLSVLRSENAKADRIHTSTHTAGSRTKPMDLQRPQNPKPARGKEKKVKGPKVNPLDPSEWENILDFLENLE